MEQPTRSSSSDQELDEIYIRIYIRKGVDSYLGYDNDIAKW